MRIKVKDVNCKNRIINPNHVVQAWRDGGEYWVVFSNDQHAYRVDHASWAAIVAWIEERS